MIIVFGLMACVFGIVSAWLGPRLGADAARSSRGLSPRRSRFTFVATGVILFAVGAFAIVGRLV
ncbi:hypothetical protein [Streptomyces sp. SID3343]|uniref:hypothetical protein n=1 Tax=Streptomyces sp. SID3343 TaxID=2690260 RepID=UPI00136C87F2|nr:hypothetical protein [Streptomyces sp. SID3343]MYW01127.1 hypothetical protein [Streptomyces sp. SID3343]